MPESKYELPYHNLDIIRCWAVLGVVIFHTVFSIVNVPFLSVFGLLSVALFFNHTSQVLMNSMYNMRREINKQGSSGMVWWERFYIQRFFRLWPVMALAILIAVVFKFPHSTLVIHEEEPVNSTRTIVIDLFMMQDWIISGNVLGVLWSLPIEMKMYLILPLCNVLYRVRSDLIPLAYLASILIGLGAIYLPVPGLWRLSILAYGPCFMSGVLVFYLIREGKIRPFIPAWLWPLVVPAWAILCVLILRVYMSGPEDKGPGWGLWVFCLGISMLLPLHKEMEENRLTRSAAVIATYSYGIYLFHFIALDIALHRLPGLPMWARWIAYFSVLVGMVYTAYHLVEAPFIRLGKRLTGMRRSLTQQASLAATAPAP